MSSIDLESSVMNTEKIPSSAFAAPDSTQNEKSNTKDTKGKEGFNPQDPVDIDSGLHRQTPQLMPKQSIMA
jgi:hypothetical protein